MNKEFERNLNEFIENYKRYRVMGRTFTNNPRNSEIAEKLLALYNNKAATENEKNAALNKLEEMRCLPTEYLEKEIKSLTSQIEKHIIPERYPNFLVNGFDCFMFRNIFINNIGFTLISKSWVKPLSEWIGKRKCLEVMSGCGSLSFALREQGTDIIPTDNFTWKGDSSWNENKNYWLDIENIDAVEAVKKYGKDVDIIVMSWAYMDDTAYRILKEMNSINPECLMIAIGEDYGGCTADDKFFDSIEHVEDKEFEKAISNFQHWDGLHDEPSLVRYTIKQIEE